MHTFRKKPRIGKFFEVIKTHSVKFRTVNNAIIYYVQTVKKRPEIRKNSYQQKAEKFLGEFFPQYYYLKSNGDFIRNQSAI